ncbi:LdpA C-terminal domain-containing domain [Pseudomonas sp. BBP2017]|uniref:Light dependent period protein LdpA domain-containing protein n=1 Tax=Pseudomonas sp. BBP2017 TaxID=2109731 RepID=UPI003531D6F7
MLASDQRLQAQVFQTDRQLCPGDFASGQVQAAVDLWRQQRARQLPATVQLAGQTLDHRCKRAGNGDIQPGQAEITVQRLVAGHRIKAGGQRQFAQPFALEIQTGINPTWCQGALQAQGLVGKIQPLILLAQS